MLTLLCMDSHGFLVGNDLSYSFVTYVTSCHVSQFYFIAVGNSVFTFAMMYHDLFIGLTFMITTIYLIE